MIKKFSPDTDIVLIVDDTMANHEILHSFLGDIGVKCESAFDMVISLICNGFNNLWMPVAAAYVAPAVYNMLVTIITGGVSMVIFFFVFKIIFPEGKAE